MIKCINNGFISFQEIIFLFDVATVHYKQTEIEKLKVLNMGFDARAATHSMYSNDDQLRVFGIKQIEV